MLWSAGRVTTWTGLCAASGNQAFKSDDSICPSMPPMGAGFGGDSFNRASFDGVSFMCASFDGADFNEAAALDDVDFVDNDFDFDVDDLLDLT